MDTLFFIVRLLSAVCNIILGIFLLATYIPKSDVFRNYVLGRRYLAISYFLLALSTVIVLLCDNEASLEVCVKTTFCMAPPLALFFSASFIVLVYPDFDLRKFLIKQLLLICSFSVAISASYLLPEGLLWETLVHYVSMMIYSLFIVYYIRVFYKIYIAYAGRLSETNHKEKEFLRWIKYTYCSVQSVIFVSVMINVYPNKIAFLAFIVFYTFFFFLFTIIYVNCVRFLLPEKKKEVLSMPSSQLEVKTDTEWEKIESKINLWLEGRHYLNHRVTIDRLSKEIGVNRTYLSSFINTFYQTNFNTWINGLRINESKKIIQEEDGVSLSEVADRVGFADSSQFSKQFKQLEGISPSQWRSK